MYTILHISDLHRSAQEPVTNETLLASLLADRDHYVTETPSIPAPDAIVVTGDLIQGARLGATDWATAVAEQYDVAYEFLASLAERMLDGDRSRLVILPGNHDVCWNTARKAMRQVPRDAEPDGIPEALFQPTSEYRWSWRDRAVFKIEDKVVYHRRLDAYWNFAERFYSDCTLLFSVERSRGFNAFELADGQIVVAVFESLYGNDCYCCRGSIKAGDVARCSLALRDAQKPWQLRIAAWHHNVQGPPAGADFMDVQTVHEMIGNGFRLGLHGHQHLAEATAHYIHLPEQQAMAVVSAGSLCAGSRELPRGIDRQYNMIIIGDDFCSARVHVREMQRGHQFGRVTRGPFGIDGSIGLTWERPTDAFGRTVNPREDYERKAIIRAEALLHSNQAEQAYRILQQVSAPSNSYARTLRIEAGRKSSQWSDIARLLAVPTSSDELLALVGALINQALFDAASAALAQYAGPLGIPKNICDDLEAKINIRRNIRR